MKTAFRRVLAAAPAFSLSACMLLGGDSLVTPGGAEDFPNTVTTLGRIAVGDISSGAQWEEIQDVQLPEMPELGGLDSLQVAPPQAKFAALGKAAVDTLDLALWQLDFTRSQEFILFGRLHAHALQETDAYERRDTVIVLFQGDRFAAPPDVLFDSVQANPGKYLLPIDYRGEVLWTGTGVRQSYRLRNTDLRGEMDWAEYATLTPQAGGGSLRKGVRINGPDGSFLSPDAVPQEYESLRRGPAGDTLEWTLVRDADWDRRLWNESARGVVDFYRRVRNPESQPELSRAHVYMRAELVRNPSLGDSLKQLFYQEQRWLRNGRVATFELRGMGSLGTLLLPNDSARMTVDTVFALRDSMIKYTAIYNLRLGSAPERMQEHVLTGYGISKYWRLGPVFHTLSAFLPSSPVSMGQPNFEGDMDFTVVHANGDTTRTEGRIGSGGMNLTLTQIKGAVRKVYCVMLDAAGAWIGSEPWDPADPPCWEAP